MIGRIARAVVCAAGAIYVAYVIFINVFLSTSLFDKVINHAEPDQIQVFYTRGWSIFPGRIHATGLRILGRDDHVEWQLDVDEITFDLALAQLARRRFIVSRVDGDGVSFRVRRRLSGPPRREAEYVNLPPIQDAGPFSVQPGHVFSYDTWLDRYYRLWTVRLDHVVAEHVREVWVDHERFEGDARITGGFYLKPVRAVEVGPVEVQIRHGRALRGSTVLAEALAGRALVRIDRFDPRLIIDITHKIVVDTDLRLRLPDVGALSRSRDAPLSGAVDVAMLALRLRRGVVDEGSHVALSSSRVTAGPVRGAVSLAAVVTAGDALHARAALAGISVGELARAEGATLAAAARLHDVTRPLADARLALEVDGGALSAGPLRATVASLRVDGSAAQLSLGHALRSFAARASTRGARLAAGPLRTAAEVSATLDVDDYRARAGVDLTTRDLVATHRGLTATARVTGAARVHDWDLRRGAVRLALDEARLTAAEVRLATASKKVVLAAPRVELTAAGARWSPRAPLDGLRLTARTGETTVADVAPLNAAWGPGFVLAARDQAKLALDAVAEVDRRVARGRVDLRAQGLGVAASRLRVFGDTVARARGVTVDLDAGTVAVDDLRAIARSVSGGTLGRRNDFTVARLEVGGRLPLTALARPSLRGADLDLTIDGAAIPDLGALQPIAGKGLVLESGQATLSANLRLSSSRREGRGVFAVAVQGGAVSLGPTRLRGDLRVRGAVRRFEAGTGELDLSGTRVELREVAVSGAAAQTQGWRGDLILRAALLRLDGRPRLDAQLAVEADDARPVLALALRDGIPKILVPFVDMPHLSGRATLAVGGGELALRNVDLDGGNLRVRGDYRSGARGARGNFTVEKGPLTLRLAIADGGVELGKVALGARSTPRSELPANAP